MEYSSFYPYEKIQAGYNTYKGTEKIPYKIIDYLLDLPDQYGYQPADDNERPRVRFIKYLWYDIADPLGEDLPTPQQKLSLKFDPYNPVLDTDALKASHPKGYRIFPQIFWGQAQTDAQTTLKIYMGQERPETPFRAEMSVVFEILSNVNLENNTKSDAYSRCYAIEQSIKEALHGVNMTGIGVFNYNSANNSRAGSTATYDDGVNVGRILTMSLTWMDDGSGAHAASAWCWEG